MREPSAEYARSFFSRLGCRVEDISVVDGEKRADLRAFLSEDEYVVEAKFREPDREWRLAMQRAEVDGFATITRALVPWMVLSNTILKAHAQLVATPASAAAFRILWVIALHDDDKFVISCVEKRLLGVRLLMAFRDLHTPPQALECYYYDDNDFERCPGIDAAVMCTREGVRLLVNHHSPNRERFHASHLCRTLTAEAARAVIDATVETQEGRALMLDTDFQGPREGNAQWRYIKEKYGKLTTATMESDFKGLAIIPAAAINSYAQQHRTAQVSSVGIEEIAPEASAKSVYAGIEHDGRRDDH